MRELTALLETIIGKKLGLKDSRVQKYAPPSNQILRAFSFVEPADVKVVIIGTSPITGEGIATGLSFSSERNESLFTDNQAIAKVHQALKKARILQKNVYYHCGHEEWAEKGVLLLNAALTIRPPKKSDSIRNIFKHYKIWKAFLQKLLQLWIDKTDLNNKLFVMRCGHQHKYPNFAKDVFSLAEKSCSEKENIKVFENIHHPTFPRRGNNFVEEAQILFKEIAESYPDIFETNQ